MCLCFSEFVTKVHLTVVHLVHRLALLLLLSLKVIQDVLLSLYGLVLILKFHSHVVDKWLEVLHLHLHFEESLNLLCILSCLFLGLQELLLFGFIVSL